MKRMKNRAFNFVAVIILTASVIMATPRPVQAGATIYANPNIPDSNPLGGCSLREAIISANTDTAFGGCAKGSGTDNIVLLPGNYKLEKVGPGEDAAATGDLDITRSLNIIGAGSHVGGGSGSLVYAESGFNDRIFHVKPPAGRAIAVTFSNMRIQGGFVSTAPGGGGILMDESQLDFPSGAYLYDVAIAGNSAAVQGGGVTNYNGSLMKIDNSTFESNNASAGSGGAIYNVGNLTIDNSLIFANQSYVSGGGIDNGGRGTAGIKNVTISSNRSSGDGAGISNSGDMTVVHATIADNQGSSGINLESGSNLSIRNSIVAYHKTGPNCVRQTSSAAFVSNSFNLVDAGLPVPGDLFTCGWKIQSGGGDFQGDPLLTDDLSFDDSNTKVYGFKKEPEQPTNSPAVDRIPEGTSSCPAYDQRMASRWVDGNKDGSVGCDIGAYEEGGRRLRLFMVQIRR